MRNWKIGWKSGYSSTHDFWEYNVYFTYTPNNNVVMANGLVRFITYLSLFWKNDIVGYLLDLAISIDFNLVARLN